MSKSPFYGWFTSAARRIPIFVEDDSTRRAKECYRKIAGDDMEMDWNELKKVLDQAMKKEFNFDGFSKDVCRSMIAMLDVDRSGRLGMEEFSQLWGYIKTWKDVFSRFDRDLSGRLNGYELKQALASVGYNVSDRMLRLLVIRYGDHRGQISFDDFVMCAIKLKKMIDTFLERDEWGMNRARFTMDEWIEKTLYC